MQADAFREVLLREMPVLNAGDKAELGADLASINWANCHELPLLAMLTSGKASGRVRQQVFLSLPMFITGSVSELILSGELPPDGILNEIIKMLMRLGLRHPCEYITKLMASLLIYITGKDYVCMT